MNSRIEWKSNIFLVYTHELRNRWGCWVCEWTEEKESRETKLINPKWWISRRWMWRYFPCKFCHESPDSDKEKQFPRRIFSLFLFSSPGNIHPHSPTAHACTNLDNNFSSNCSKQRKNHIWETQHSLIWRMTIAQKKNLKSKVIRHNRNLKFEKLIQFLSADFRRLERHMRVVLCAGGSRQNRDIKTPVIKQQ